MLEKWIARHWIALCVGCVLMGIALRVAYAERGYMAFGSEWLIIPVVFVAERYIRKYVRRRKRAGLQRNTESMEKRGTNCKTESMRTSGICQEESEISRERRELPSAVVA